MSERRAVGSLQIELSEGSLSAIAFFYPDPDGIEWTREKLLRLVAEEGIVYGFDPGSADSLLAGFAACHEGPCSAVVAAGDAPELSVPGEAAWDYPPVPDELLEDAERAFLKAGPPDITIVRIERRKVEKVVRKKRILPFLKPKTDRVTAPEKREVKVRIAVDPAVTDRGWVEKGSRIAIVTRSRPGKPGRDVRGRAVPPPPVRDLPVYAGAGTEIVKGEIRAVTDGFLRRGADWVDVIPFRCHRFEVAVSRDRSTHTLSFYPGQPESRVPEPNDILAAAEEAGAFREDLGSEGEIRAAVSAAVRRGASLEGFILSKARNSLARIDVSADGLEAAITLRKGAGSGKALDLGEVSTIIRESGLKGMDLPRIREEILAFYRGPSRNLEGFVLAAGTPQERGDPGTFDYSVPFLDETESVVIVERDATAGARAYAGVRSIAGFPPQVIRDRAVVQKDLEVARVKAARPGRAGRNVYGEPILSDKAEGPAVRLFENLEQVGESVVSKIDGILECGGADGTYLLRVRPRVDAKTSIVLSPDRMSAEAFLTPAAGCGAPMTEETVIRALAGAGITRGIDHGAVKAAVERLNGEGSVSGFVAARGTPPRHGKAPEIRFHVRLSDSKGVTVKGNGRADFRNQDRITYVKRGDLLAEIPGAPEEPVDGTDLLGGVIEADPAGRAVAECGAGVRTENLPNGGARFYSLKNGALLYEAGFLDVLEVFTVDGDVDLHVGNVKFGGMIHVKGSVRSGFHLMSEEGILVDEFVEASLLSAGSGIKVGCGIKGAGKAVLRTKRSIEANYAEGATLLAVGDVILDRACIHSQVKCNGRLVLEGERGSLIGGAIKARLGIEVENIGTLSGSRTRVSFGQDYLVGDRADLLGKEILRLLAEARGMDETMGVLERQRKTAELAELRRRKLICLKTIDQRRSRLLELGELLELHHDSSVVVRGTVYPGTVIESHGRTLEVNDIKRNVSFFFDPGSAKIEVRQNR